ncbi:hypothetical protein FLA_1845 [Filimonas lacunae]|nr:hypothetical protein FLA_1845 [Filimonas lacunae]
MILSGAAIQTKKIVIHAVTQRRNNVFHMEGYVYIFMS